MNKKNNKYKVWCVNTNAKEDNTENNDHIYQYYI